MPTTKSPQRSRAKSAATAALPTALNQTVLLRIEPRLKWTGSIDLVPLAGGGGRAIHVQCHDAKLKLELNWRGSQASESAALIAAFDAIEDWISQLREEHPGPHRIRLLDVCDQLQNHRRQLVVEGVPDTHPAAGESAAVSQTPAWQ